MPVPNEYQRIGDQLYAFLTKARDQAGLGSTHQSYTMAQGVFRAFRSRLSLEQAIEFSNVLPAGVRALFVADWNPRLPRLPWCSRAAMTREAQSLRAPHNFSPDTAIHDVAVALRSCADEVRLDRTLGGIGLEAADFWATEDEST
jgi:uncharacterized protein (DUF2267 family)